MRDGTAAKGAEAAAVTPEREAIDFLVDSISSQALAARVPISEGERRLLTQCPVSTDDAEEPEDGFAERMAGLLRRAYKALRAFGAHLLGVWRKDRRS
jgi:hypothetical protein